MRQRYDQLAKRILEQALAPMGQVTRQHEVSPDALYVDLWFVPSPEARPQRARLGLLGEMVGEPCMIEAFHEAPDPDELRTCLEKELALYRQLKGGEPALAEPPMLWVLSAGRPDSVLSCGFTPVKGGLPGLYQQPLQLVRVTIVVLSELPRVRETLALRLLGAGQTMKHAIEDLAQLPRDSWEADLLIPVLARLRFEIDQIDRKLRTDEETLLMAAQQTFEEFLAPLVSPLRGSARRAAGCSPLAQGARRSNTASRKSTKASG